MTDLSDKTKPNRRENDTDIAVISEQIIAIKISQDALFQKAEKALDLHHKLEVESVKVSACLDHRKGLRKAISAAVKWPQKVAIILLIAILMIVFAYIADDKNMFFKTPFGEVSPAGAEIKMGATP